MNLTLQCDISRSTNKDSNTVKQKQEERIGSIVVSDILSVGPCGLRLQTEVDNRTDDTIDTDTVIW